MGNVIVGATMSLDWFMNDRNGDVSRLYSDFEALHKTEMLQEEIMSSWSWKERGCSSLLREQICGSA